MNKEYQKQWIKNNPLKISAYRKKWRDKNKEKEKIRIRKWQIENPEKVIKQQRKWAYSNGRNWKKAGIKNKNNKIFGFKDYEELFDLQQGQCVICEKSNLEMNQRLCVDHNHQTGKVRGLLCKDCNSGLGFFKDNIQFLEKAEQYLKNFI